MKLIARASLSILLIGIAVYFVDLTEVVRMIAGTYPLTWVLVFAVFLIQIFLIAVRWKLCIEVLGFGTDTRALLNYTFMGQFAGLFLPASVGGAAVKAWMVYRDGLAGKAAFASVVLDRILATSSLILMGAIGLPFLTISVLGQVNFRTLAFLGMGSIGVVGAVWFLARIPGIGAAVQYVLDVVRKVADARFLSLGLGVSILGQVAMILVVYLLAAGARIDLSIIDCLLILPPVMLISALPISIAGWGVREGAMIVGLGLAGVPSEQALALSIQFALAGSFVSLLGAIPWFSTIDAKMLAQIQEFKPGGS